MDKEFKQDPNTPKYNTTTGLLTDYGKSVGMKEVNKLSTISADTLQGDRTQIKLPTPSPYYEQEPTLLEATTDAQREQNRIIKQKETEGADISKLIADIGGVEGKEAQYATDQGADEAQKEYDRFSSELEAEQLALRRRTEEVRKTFGGTTAGLQSELGRIERDSLSKQADLAILGNAAKGRFDTAISIAQRKVESELRPLQAQLDAKKFVYENNKDLFSKAELSKLDTLIKADERKLDEETKNKEASNEMIINAIQGKAPTSLVSKAQELYNKGASKAEIAKVLGNYSMSLSDRLDTQLKTAQINKLNQELTQSNPDAGELVKIGGKDYIRYKDGSISEPVLPEAADTGMVVSRLDEKIKVIDSLLPTGSKGSNVALSTSAGKFRGAPIPFLYKDSINDWRAGIINLTQKLTVDELGRVKSDGVTFGALSNGERQAVGQAATILNSGQIYKGSGDDKEPTGRFKLSEDKVVEALNTIKNAYLLDFERRTGISYDTYKQNPEAMKQVQADNFIDQAGTALEANFYGGYPTN